MDFTNLFIAAGLTVVALLFFVLHLCNVVSSNNAIGVCCGCLAVNFIVGVGSFL